MIRNNGHIALLLTFMLTLPEAAASAQETVKDTLMVSVEKTEDSPLLAGWGRIGAKLNMVDLLCTVPNIGLEFDLGNDKYSRSSLSLTARYNWHEAHSYQPYIVINVMEFRPEYRRYERGLQRTRGVFYWGIYGSAGKYSLKLSENGNQGYMFGGGVSIGTAQPLHQYKKFAIDLEIGGSLGACVRNASQYTLAADRRSYVMLPDGKKPYGVAPFPVLTEVRVAFVFRKVSVRERYQLTEKEITAIRKKQIARKEKKEGK